MKRSTPCLLPASRILVLSSSLLVSVFCLGCDNSQTLAVDMPLHLEEHLDDATIIGSEVPADLLRPVEWRFDEPQPGWKAVIPRPFPPGIRPAAVSQTDDALRITLGPSNANPNGVPVGGAYVDVPEWDHRDWAHVLIRARSSGPGTMSLGFNVWDREGHPREGRPAPYEMGGAQNTRLVGDSTVQTYQLRMEPAGPWEEPIEQLGLWMWSDDHLEVEILSITVVPMDALYGDAPAGVRTLEGYDAVRRTLYMHAPGNLSYRIAVPSEGRLDFGLGVLQETDPVTFRVTATARGSGPETLFEETYSDPENWAQRSVDLSHLAGQSLDLAIEAGSERAGTVALWVTPTVSGERGTSRPNVILYFVDGFGAEYLSLYGYNLRTTPNLERLAAGGAMFEQAYTNARWTTPSTTSFMTSLQHSVVGGTRSERNQLPERAVTMAQRFHRAGYQTAVYTGNPNAASSAGLGLEVDVLRDWVPWDGVVTSARLQDEFWKWRSAYPGEPYWAHFQTIDVWGPGELSLQGPFEGMYVSAGERNQYIEWRDELRAQNPGHWWRPDQTAFDEAGIDRVTYHERGQLLYAEAVAQQDHQIGRFVDQLKASGEWENTLFIVASDHGQHESGLVRVNPYAPQGQHTNLRQEHTGIPLLFVWPGHIPGGQRFRDPVSMIDLLPTVLELAGLPQPEVMQGRSLAPLLLGEVPEAEWPARPVILDEFYVDEEAGALKGWIEVVDGRWGA
ncbi:MAG: sulfatase, partial [Gemmatimonadota bacterium]